MTKCLQIIQNLPLNKEKLFPTNKQTISKISSKILLKFILNKEMQGTEYSKEDLDFLKEELLTEVSNFIESLTSLEFEESTLIISLIYFEKLSQSSKFDISAVEYEDYFLSCLILSSKMFEERFWNTKKFLSKFGVMDTKIIKIEMEVLNHFNFNLSISKLEFDSFIKRFETI